MTVMAIIDRVKGCPCVFFYTENPNGVPIKWLRADLNDFDRIKECLVNLEQDPEKWLTENPDIFRAILDYAFERKL